MNSEEYNIVCLLEPTSPFTSAKDIESAFKELSNNSKARSLVGVGICESQHPTYLNFIDKNDFLIPYHKEEKIDTLETGHSRRVIFLMVQFIFHMLKSFIPKILLQAIGKIFQVKKY